MVPPTLPPKASSVAPPPYEPTDSADTSTTGSDTMPASAAYSSAHHNAPPPPAFTSRESTLVVPRSQLRTSATTKNSQAVTLKDNDYPDEKAILKQQDEMQGAPMPGAPSPAGLPLRPTPPLPTPSYPEAPSGSNRLGFFRNSVSNLRGSLYAPRQSRPRMTAAEVDAGQMEAFAQRLEVENRMSPSAAEAELRVMQLRSDAVAASNRVGPRAATGIFKASCSTDLLFLIDVTGSMTPYIDATKSQVKKIVSDINRTFFNEADVRVAVVAYRDHNDKSRIEFLDFTTDVAQVFKFLDKLLATGGDDLAEDVLGGLDEALKASWKNQTRCIMHIADAPAHGNNLHDLGIHSDHFSTPGSEPHGLKFGTIMKRMIKQKINYIFFRISDTTDRMIFNFMMAYAAATSNCKLHSSNKLHGHAEQWQEARKRNKSRMLAAIDRKMEEEGGLHFDEVQLGINYSSLRHLVVNGVTASSSRTAVRLSAGMSSSGTRSSYAQSKLGHKSAKLDNLAEDDEVDVFGEAQQWQAELPGKLGRDETKTSTVADTIVEADEDKDWVTDEDGENDEDTANQNETKAKGSKQDRAIKFDTGEPQWNKAGWLDQTMHVKAFSPDLIDATATAASGSVLDRMMLSDDNIRISTNELIIHRRTTPFAQGALRLASYARTQESTNPLVVKTFKANGKRLADLAEDMRMQALCKAFALEFNSLVASEKHSLDFIVVTCLQPIVPATQEAVGDKGKQQTNGDDDESQEEECMSLEPMLLNGRYVKYNNNCGSVNDDGESEVSKAAQAFSHFTFERSKGQLLVSDLQGVGNVLTDPAVHTRDPSRFVLTDTNLGEDGFKLFFSSHKCNSVCEKLGLKSNADMFISNDFTFLMTWPIVTFHHTSSNNGGARKVRGFGKNTSGSGSGNGAGNGAGSPYALVCCSNKLCSRIVSVATAKKTVPSFYWCNKCWPQLSSSTVKRVCATPGAYHEFDVSKFFFESQGQLMPRTCSDHGGVPSLPVDFQPKPKSKGLGFFRRRKADTTS